MAKKNVENKVEMVKFEERGMNIEFNVENKTLLVDGKEIKNIKSKSDMFRTMYEVGMEICEISKLTKSHYSFVYEVISNANDGKVRNVKKESKSDEFRRLYDEGHTVGQIAKMTNSNYSFVHTQIKKYKASKEVVNQ